MSKTKYFWVNPIWGWRVSSVNLEGWLWRWNCQTLWLQDRGCTSAPSSGQAILLLCSLCLEHSSLHMWLTNLKCEQKWHTLMYCFWEEVFNYQCETCNILLLLRWLWSLEIDQLREGTWPKVTPKECITISTLSNSKALILLTFYLPESIILFSFFQSFAFPTKTSASTAQ